MERLRQWSWVMVLVVGLILFEVVRRALAETDNPNLVPSLILLGAAVIPASFVTFIYQRRLDYAAMDSVLLLRGVLSPAAHMAWTGLAAAALWQATRPGRPHRFRGFLLAFGIAVVLHATWDSIGSILGYLVLAVISLALLTRTAHNLSRDRGLIPLLG